MITLLDPSQVAATIEVRYAETDQMGVVHHANYLVWFEVARTRLCATTAWPYPAIEALGYWLMVTGANLQYRGGARYGDTAAVHCWLDELRSRTMRFGYRVERSGEVLVNGTTDHAWVNATTKRTCRMPEEVRPAFVALARK